MNKNCIGCGIALQNEDQSKAGYTNNLKNDFCLRCFKIQNYGDYTSVNDDNTNYIKLIKNIGQRRSLVLLVIDLLSVPSNLEEIRSFLLNNKVILVLNKKDLMPKSISDNKLRSYFLNKKLNLAECICVSAEKNYNLDLLLSLIKEHRTDDRVYVVGNTNAGKSSIIDKLISLYDNRKSNITLSPMLSTTLSDIEVNFQDYKLIDTPGLIYDGNILNYVDKKNIKKLSPRKEIKPKTYRMVSNTSLVIDNMIRIDYIGSLKNSFTLFISNDLEVKKIYSQKNNTLKNNFKKEIVFPSYSDIAISGLGFIKIREKGSINLYLPKEVTVTIRKSII